MSFSSRSLALGLSLVLASVGLSLAEEPTPGNQTAQATTVEIEKDGASAKVELRYWLYLPPQYKADGEKWPLLLFLHGSGERGDNLDLVKKHGPPKLIAEGKEMPFVVVSPQCPKETRWNAAELAKLVDHLANTLRIDRSRLYVTGLSMGGSGTWSLLAEKPELFAAAAPICGRGDPATAVKFARVPVWVFVGDKDRAETVQNCRDMAEALRRAGDKQVELSIYPGVPHDSWTETYNNPKLYDWLLSHRRSATASGGR